MADKHSKAAVQCYFKGESVLVPLISSFVVNWIRNII